MNTTDYVSYPLALALKEAGFDELCQYYYNPKGMLRIAKDNALSPDALNNRYLDEIDGGLCSAVPLWQAQKWLREEKYIHVEPAYAYEGKFILYIKSSKLGLFKILYQQFDTYEQALSAGIAAALELIEKKGDPDV